MKKIIIICAEFSPSTLPSTLRSRCFAQHLPKLGWETIIVTTDPVFYDNPLDLEYKKLINNNFRLISTNAIPRKISKKIGIGDLGIRGFFHLLKKIYSICRQENIDLILIPVPTYFPMLIGRLINIRYKIPYVIDYMDPWAPDEYWSLPKHRRPPKWRYAYTFARIVEAFALKNVTALTAVSSGTIDIVKKRYKWLRDIKSCIIPCGFEPLDFQYVLQNASFHEKFIKIDEAHINFYYIGAYTETMELTISHLFLAFKQGLEINFELFNRVRLLFVGTNYNGPGIDKILPLAKKYSIEAYVVEIAKRVSYLDSLRVMMDASVLMLLGSSSSHYTASKIFPYIYSKKKILGVFHESSNIKEIMQKICSETIITYNTKIIETNLVNKINSRMTDLILNHAEREIINQAELNNYTCEGISRKLVSFIGDEININ